MQEASQQIPPITLWPGLTPYLEGVTQQEAAVAAVLAGQSAGHIFMCEHEAVLTIGSSGSVADIGPHITVPVVETGRGGQVTYHGPGQRVVYLVVKLEVFHKDIRAYVRWLEGWLIEALATLGVKAFTTKDVGVWVNTPRGIEKIAAIGVRVRKGVAFHGIALNVTNDLGIYQQFTPCGITDKGVTNLATLLPQITLEEVDATLIHALQRLWPHKFLSQPR